MATLPDSDMVGVCGLYCGACPHYRASLTNGVHLIPDGIRNRGNDRGFTCRGCRSGTLYLHPGCTDCTIRSCAEETEIDHCGRCPVSPCTVLTDFQHDGRPHHLDIIANLKDLNDKGEERWLETQRERWTCRCGTQFSWYEVSCHTCGSSLESYGRDERKKEK